MQYLQFSDWTIFENVLQKFFPKEKGQIDNHIQNTTQKSDKIEQQDP